MVCMENGHRSLQTSSRHLYSISSGCGRQTRDHLCEVPEMGGGKTCRGKVLSLQPAAFSHHVVSDVFQCARITTNVLG